MWSFPHFLQYFVSSSSVHHFPKLSDGGLKFCTVADMSPVHLWFKNGIYMTIVRAAGGRQSVPPPWNLPKISFYVVVKRSPFSQIESWRAEIWYAGRYEADEPSFQKLHQTNHGYDRRRPSKCATSKKSSKNELLAITEGQGQGQSWCPFEGR